MSIRILNGDCREIIKTLADKSVHSVVTSPPYWGLRDYGTGKWEGGDPDCDHKDHSSFGKQRGQGKYFDSGVPYHVVDEDRGGRPNVGPVCPVCGAVRIDRQIGLEPAPDDFAAEMVAVFREVRRVLRDDGTLWLNLGDSYSRNPAKGGSGPNGKHDYMPDYSNARRLLSETKGSSDGLVGRGDRAATRNGAEGLKEKDLVGIPWLVAFALRTDGWYLRSDIIWHKPNPMPESVTDRPTSSHEHVFLLTKQGRYFYDAEAIREDGSDNPVTTARNDRSDKGLVGAQGLYGTPQGQSGSGTYVRNQRQRINIPSGWDMAAGGHGTIHRDGRTSAEYQEAELKDGRNARNVWTIATSPFPEAHFATFPPELAERCIKAGSKPGDTILDPFAGAFTTAMVADRLQRNAIGIELNPDYCEIARRRLIKDAGLFADVSDENHAG